MRPLAMFQLLILPLAFVVCGCASNNKGKIEGTKWVSQPTTVKGKALPAGILQLEFRADGSMLYRIGPQALSGRYSLGMGNSVTFNMDQELAGRKSHTETIVINGNQLTMTDTDGTTLTFNRAK
jgi:hypothetical protein